MSDLDRYLSDWLADSGPQDVPDRIVDAGIAKAVTTRRARALPGALGRLFAVEVPAWPIPRPAGQRLATWAALAALLAALLGMALISAGGRPNTDGIRNGLIAFDRQGDIWVVRGDGTDLHPLTSTPDTETAPVWSPDGTRLAIWVTSGTVAEIHVTDPDGRLVQRLAAPEGMSLPLKDGIAGWSPDGGRIVAPVRTTTTEGDLTTVGIPAVVVFDVATGSATLVDVPSLAGDTRPARMSFGFSPDGRQLGITDWPNGMDAISVIDPAGGDLKQLFEGQGVGGARFTADGSGVIFHDTSEADPNGSIAIVDLAGKVSSIVAGPTNDLAPAISWAGDRVAFSRSPAVTVPGAYYEGYPSDLYVVPISGGDPRLVGTGTWPGATWSPDGTRLAAWAMDEQRLMVFRTDGSADPVSIPTPDDTSAMSWQKVWPKR